MITKRIKSLIGFASIVGAFLAFGVNAVAGAPTPILNPKFPLRIAESGSSARTSNWATCISKALLASPVAGKLGIQEVIDITGPINEPEKSSEEEESNVGSIELFQELTYLISSDTDEVTISFFSEKADSPWFLDRMGALAAMAMMMGSPTGGSFEGAEPRIITASSMSPLAILKSADGTSTYELDLTSCTSEFAK